MEKVLNIVLVAALASFCHSAFAQKVHTWTDENGVVHFSQIAPDQDEQPSEETRLRSAPILGGTLAPAKEPEPKNNGGNNTSGDSGTSQDLSIEEPPKNPAMCQKARDMIATINSGRRIRIEDPATGEPKYATAEDLQDQRKNANDAIKRHCP